MFRLNRRYSINTFIILFFTLSTVSSMALVMEQEKGCWPESWPKELETYRTKARTIEIAAGNQENVYEIFFQDRADFENIWPTILELKDKGAPIRLKSIEKSFDEKVGLFNNTKPLVRIFAHVYPARPVQLPGGKELIPAPPWPESVKNPAGELPEYVMKSEYGNSWVPAEGREHRGFIYRARTDIELVVDGRVINPNRIRLPSDTLIIDQSKLEKKHAGQGEEKNRASEQLSGGTGEDENNKIIAIVLGKKIFSKDIEPPPEIFEKNKREMKEDAFNKWLKQYREFGIGGLIGKPLIEEYANENNINVTDAEIEEYYQGIERWFKQKKAELSKELETPNIGEERRKAIESRIKMFNEMLERQKARGSSTTGKEPAKVFIKNWKINKSLFEKYGGRVIFQQAGPEPLDAYRLFLQEQEKSGRFEVKDKRTADLFWNYFTNDKMHTFYSNANEAEKLMKVPWWLMETGEGLQKPAGQVE